jgi:hypothetical protein
MLANKPNLSNRFTSQVAIACCLVLLARTEHGQAVDPYPPGLPGKLERWRSQSKAIAYAVESYMVDNAKYPGSYMELTSSPLFGQARPVNYFRGSGMSKIGDGTFSDPFDPNRALSYMPYNVPASYGWFLQSMGPDGKADIEPGEYKAWNPEWIRTAIERTYDVSNGTLSSGDLWSSTEVTQWNYCRASSSSLTLEEYVRRPGICK